ncbi:MAG: PAS domain S-box protein [Candidatus Saliniplasma sp.]
MKRELSYLILGQQGGENRIKILEKLKERSYNLNQLAKELDLNYRTIKHHVDILLEYDLIVSSGDGYGKVYFLSEKLEENYEILQDMKSKLHTVFKSPKLYKKIVQQTRDGIIILDENTDIIFLNNSAEKITGYKDEELLGNNIEKLLEFDSKDSLEQLLTKGEFFEKKAEIISKSGEIKNLVFSLHSFCFNGEKNKGFSLLMKDITKETKQRDVLDALMDHSEVMMAYLNTDFDLLYVNFAYAKYTDHSPKELIGKNHFDLFPNGENKKIFNKVLENEEPVSVKDQQLIHMDGSDQKGIHWSLEPIKNDGDKVKGLILSSYQITDGTSS